MNILDRRGVKTSLLFLLIAGCLFVSGCAALQEAQQRRQARMEEKRREANMPMQWIKSISEGMTAASQMNKPIMMDFYTDW